MKIAKEEAGARGQRVPGQGARGLRRGRLSLTEQRWGQGTQEGHLRGPGEEAWEASLELPNKLLLCFGAQISQVSGKFTGQWPLCVRFAGKA